MTDLIDRFSVLYWRRQLNYGNDADRQNAGHDACDAVLKLLGRLERQEIELKEALHVEQGLRAKIEELESAHPPTQPVQASAEFVQLFEPPPCRHLNCQFAVRDGLTLMRCQDCGLAISTTAHVTVFE